MIAIPIIMGITSGASFLLGFLLLNHPQKINRSANRWLGIFVITLGLAMLEILLVEQKFHLYHEKYFELIGISRFLSAPALYLAILNFTTIDKSVKIKYVYHFIPFIIIILFTIPFLATGHNIKFSANVGKIIFFILRNILPVQAIVYWVLSYKKLREHLKNIATFSSATTPINLSWLENFLFLLVLIIVCWFNMLYFDIQIIKNYTPIFYLLCVFFLAYFSLQQKEVFSFNADEIKDLSQIIVAKNDDSIEKKKRLNDLQLIALNEKLIALINTEKPFLENDLNLPHLAARIGASSNETSYLINKIYNQNFYTFINTYRVEEAKELLSSGTYQKLNILGIAYQSGFNSKTTFNTTFKKFTGQSPTDFVKQKSSSKIS